MKKYIALLLVAVMLIGLMAGCGKKADDGKVKVALVILSGDHGFTGESVKHAELEAKALTEKYDNLEVVVKSCGEAADQPDRHR